MGCAWEGEGQGSLGAGQSAWAEQGGALSSLCTRQGRSQALPESFRAGALERAAWAPRWCDAVVLADQHAYLWGLSFSCTQLPRGAAAHPRVLGLAGPVSSLRTPRADGRVTMQGCSPHARVTLSNVE